MGSHNFRRRPVLVKAIRYLPSAGPDCNCAEVCEFLDMSDLSPCVDEDCSRWPLDFDFDREIAPGDWVVKVGDDAFEVVTSVRFVELFEEV